MNDDDDIIEIRDTTSHLYRIIPEVKNIILTALDVFSRLPVAIDKSKISQAINALGYPLPSSSETVAPTITTNVGVHSDPIKEAMWKNTLDVIRLTVKREIAQATDSTNKEQLERILNVIPNVI